MGNKNKTIDDIVNDVVANIKFIYINDELYFCNKFNHILKAEDIILRRNIFYYISEKYNEKFHTMRTVNLVLELIKINNEIERVYGKNDVNSEFINCKNCIIDLRENKINFKYINLDNNWDKIKRKWNENLHKKNKMINFLNLQYKEKYIHNGYDDKFTYDLVTTNYINDFKKSIFNEFIKDITDNDYDMERVLKQIMGYCISNLNCENKYFIFYGERNSGKSTFLSLISHICGEDNISKIMMKDLDKKSCLAEIFMKLINIEYNLSSDQLKYLNILNPLISNIQVISGQKARSKEFKFHSKTKFIFETNINPIDDIVNYNEDHIDKIILIPFSRKEPDNKNLNKILLNQLKEEEEIIFAWAIDGLKEYIDNGFNFSSCKRVTENLERYKNNKLSIDKFIINNIEYKEGTYIFGYQVKKQLQDYFCDNESKNMLNKEFKNFKELILQKYNSIEYIRINKDGENKYGFTNIKIKL